MKKTIFTLSILGVASIAIPVVLTSCTITSS